MRIAQMRQAHHYAQDNSISLGSATDDHVNVAAFSFRYYLLVYQLFL